MDAEEMMNGGRAEVAADTIEAHFINASTDVEEAMEQVLQTTEVSSPAVALKPSPDTITIAVWMDKPLKKQESKIQKRRDGDTGDKECRDKESRDKEMDVPLYDRAWICALPSQDVENPDGYVYAEPQDGSRCFNCGSYSHAVRNCPRPHCLAAIRNARATALNKKGPRSRTPSRYYQCARRGKFDDLKPGVLSHEARKAIGIGELDPPPWLHRMRQIGYPPGYLEEAEDESSGVQIIDDDTQAVTGKESSNIAHDLENLFAIDKPKAELKMSVDYPGINIPIPENADPERWAAPPEINSLKSRGCKRPYHQISHMNNNGSGPYSPHSPWAGGMGGADFRGEEGRVSSQSRGHSESSNRQRFDEVEPQIDIYGSNLYCAMSPVDSMNGSWPIYPTLDWSNRRLSGTSSLAAEGTIYHDAWSGMRTYYHHRIPSRPSGLASPLRGMFQTPGAAEPMPSTSQIYSRQNYYQSQTEGRPLPKDQSSSQTSSKAWLKAQAALDAIAPHRISGGLSSSPCQVPTDSVQIDRDPRVQHQLGEGN